MFGIYRLTAKLLCCSEEDNFRNTKYTGIKKLIQDNN